MDSNFVYALFGARQFFLKLYAKILNKRNISEESTLLSIVALKCFLWVRQLNFLNKKLASSPIVFAVFKTLIFQIIKSTSLTINV